MKVLDLFSGVGGFALGLEYAGFDIRKFCEIEPHCRRVLSKNFPETPIEDDIKELSIKRGEYDLICGGFPCQDISIAGKNAGIHGEKSGLWSEYKRLINEGQPKYAIIENVFALLGRGIEVILQDLAEIGYDATWTLYDSKYFGKPQRRRRVYIVAVRDGIPANCDIFENGLRDLKERRPEMEAFDKSFRWNFKEGEGDKHSFTFVTRQRSNEFKETGLSSTLAKRDYKSYTDLVLQDGIIRRVIPQERMLLQGFPADWLDNCGLTTKEMFTCNGMSVPVVRYIGRLIFHFDKQVSAPCGAEFYADGHYRVYDNSDMGSSIIHEGVRYPSVFSVNHLTSRGDYLDFRSTPCNKKRY
ncbi:C-5 cytosine-specific DNA methylase [Vibrio phage 1.052.A._10N.286.46.C3]|nr:C-5 cytosine-specific DNA methylase [Vibrio phage 1.052.A._10N.286.46.C3]